jgi:hypothetical protein
MEGIDLPYQPFGDLVEDARHDGATGMILRQLVERFSQRRHVAGYLVRLLMEGCGHAAQHLREARPPIARRRREVGPTPEGLAVGCQEHGQRPAAGLAEQRQCRLIDRIQIRPLLPVDLDADEQVVHHIGDVGVLKALMGHYMAPVTGGVSDRQQDGLAFGPGSLERFLAPRHPMHRIALVLEQVGTGFMSQQVSGHGAHLSMDTGLWR